MDRPDVEERVGADTSVSRREILVSGGKFAVLAAMLGVGGTSLTGCGETVPTPASGASGTTPAGVATTGTTSVNNAAAPTVASLAVSADTSGTPKPGGTLTIVRVSDPLKLWPGQNSGLSDIATHFLLYDALVIKGFDDKIYPSLAESWTQSEDGKVWTFKLRRDVKFHSGEPFTSAHVVDHFNRWKKMPTSNKISLLEKTEATGDYTVVFRLSSPTLVFLNNISQTEFAYGSIPNMKKVMELGDDYGVKGVDGTGPYRLERWVKDDRMVLVRNDDYKWASPIYANTAAAFPKEIIFRVVPEAAGRTNLIETGEVGMNIDVAPQDVQRLSALPGVVVRSFPRLSSNHIGFNMKKELFQDINLRRAFTHAIKRDDITQFVMAEQADPAEGYLHPQASGALPREQTKVYVAFDPAKSAMLLEQSGWKMGADGIREKDGKKLSFTLYLSDETGERIAQVVQAQVKKVGFDMKVRRLEPAANDAALKAGEHDARFIPMIYSTPDHMYFFVTSSIPSPNTVFYSNPAFDDLFKKSQTTTDNAERLRIFGEMEKTLLDQAPVVPIQHIKWIYAWQDKVKGTKFHNVQGIYRMMDTWLA